MHILVTSLVHEGNHSVSTQPDSIDEELASVKAELAAYQGMLAAGTRGLPRRRGNSRKTASSRS